MTHCDVIALLSHCKPMEIGIQQRVCKFVANIFQNDTPVLRTIVSTALNNPLSVFCSNYNTICGQGNMNCLEVRANLYKDWLVSLSGGLICNANALRELLGMRDGTHVSVLSLMKRAILMTTFVWIEILRLFMYHFLSYTLWLTFCHNLLLFIVIACVFICLFTLHICYSYLFVLLCHIYL